METVYIRHLKDVHSLKAEPCVMALGFFDGVHLGHRKVIASAKKISEKKKLKLAVMTFFPHPKEVFSDSTKMNYLTPMDVKTEILSELGVDKVYVINFTKNFASLSPKEFVFKYLVNLGVVHAVAGFDFTYGSKGLGTMETILADGDGSFLVTTVPKMEQAGRKISSTLIRELLEKGEVQRVSEYLGNYYETRGKILPFSRALKPGTITVEMITAPYFTLPKVGSYEVEAQIAGRTYQGSAKVGPSNTLMLSLRVFSTIKHSTELSIKLKWIDQIREKSRIKSMAN